MNQLPSLLASAHRRALTAPLVGEEASPTRTAGLAKRAPALLLALGMTAVAAAEYSGLMPIAWLAVGPLLGSLMLSPRITAALAVWSILLGLALTTGLPGPPGGL